MSEEDNQIIKLRREKLTELRQEGIAFPNQFKPQQFIEDILSQYADTPKETLEADTAVFSVAGRIMLNRGSFMVIQDMTARIQLYVNRKSLAEDQLKSIKRWDLGDIVGVVGDLHRSNKGDLYIEIQSFQLLTKSIRPLPEKHHGLKDTESKYRQRYVDLIVNEETRSTFKIRAQVIQHIRHFLSEKQFIEVETPMMHPIPGGATARPFATHHNALDMSLFLRIAPELYLKRLVVGGMERVFEINRNFRNEGLSTRHNPEFTMLEFYQAYADYHDLIHLTENLFNQLALAIFGQETFIYQEQEISFAKPFQNLAMTDAIIKYVDEINETNINDIGFLNDVATKKNIAIENNDCLGHVHLAFFEELVETQLIQPTFISSYPIEVSPLARQTDNQPELTDRFELFIAGKEIANGFSELNDPEDQANRFKQQVAAKEAGDDEAMHYDEDYIQALEYGMPPTAGEGIGIDRLVMLLVDAPSIKDVILFPQMRPLNS